MRLRSFEVSPRCPIERRPATTIDAPATIATVTIEAAPTSGTNEDKFTSSLRGSIGRRSLMIDDAGFIPGFELRERCPTPCLYIETGAEESQPLFAVVPLADWRGEYTASAKREFVDCGGRAMLARLESPA
jgi:hypothetical protein